MMELILYHGTDHLFQEIDLGKSVGRRDFGIGFYTTTIAALSSSVEEVSGWVVNMFTMGLISHWMYMKNCARSLG